MAHHRTYRQMARFGGGLGVLVITRSRSGHAHEYWIGGGITRHRQRWGYDASQAFRFKSKDNATQTLRRLKERDGYVLDVRAIAIAELLTNAEQVSTS